MALAARVYGPFDAAFAAACSTSAVSAWNWLVANPSRVPAGGFVNLYGHTGATYILGSEIRRRLWAAAEIFRLNGTVAARNYVDAHWGDGLEVNGVWYPDAWADVANMGGFTYVDTPGATAAVVAGNWWSIRNSTLSSATGWNTRVNQDGYACAASSTPPYGDYYWGFTGVILRYAWTLVQAWRYDGTADYLEAAREQLHYVLGRNPMGKVYVTGVGTRPVLHPHGGWNFAAGYTNIDDALCRPVPFLLVGGPNKADNSSISPWPGRCYEDIADPDYFFKGNYTLNETSVNIQASLIVLAGIFGTGGTATGVPVEPAPPVARIISATPNPFRASTTIRWASAHPGCELSDRERTVLILDVAGRVVRRLVAPPAGDRIIEIGWNGENEAGDPAASGVYTAVPLGRRDVAARVIRLNH
jgi:endoglucanase